MRALGNGAPDIFTALAGISGAHDFELVAGELLGASNFISTVVLAAVLLHDEQRLQDQVAQVLALLLAVIERIPAIDPLGDEQVEHLQQLTESWFAQLRRMALCLQSTRRKQDVLATVHKRSITYDHKLTFRMQFHLAHPVG